MYMKEDKGIYILRELNTYTGNRENNPLVGKYDKQVINNSRELLIDFCQGMSEDNEQILSS